MSAKQILVGVLSGLLIVAVILNILVDINFYGWALVISWICTIGMLTMAILIFVGLGKALPPNHYTSIFTVLIVIDILQLFVFIIFEINYLFNWAKIVSIAVITPLIVSVHLYKNELQNSSDMNSLLNSPHQQTQNQTPYQTSNQYITQNQTPMELNNQTSKPYP